MAMNIIGAGVGRTGTYSLKLAINQLGLGPCHHMDEVIHNMPVNVPLWSAAVAGEPLCSFLGVPAPTEAFPRTNHREEFWDRVNGKI